MRNMTVARYMFAIHMFIRYFIYGLHTRNTVTRTLYISSAHFSGMDSNNQLSLKTQSYLLETQLMMIHHTMHNT